MMFANTCSPLNAAVTDSENSLSFGERCASEGRVVTIEEEQRLIELGTGERLDYDLTKTFVDLFVEQVRKTPDNVAVFFNDRRYTYRQVDEITDELARMLVREGVMREMVVGVMTDRSALPEPEILMAEYVEPRNVEETLLCEMIKQVLGITTLGVKDNLKALGMTSIKAMKVMAAMHTIGFNGLKLDHIIKASDVIDLIRLKNNNIDECGSWLGGFDGLKPVIVLCCGVISDRMIADCLNSWRERYNVYVIQPVFNSWPDYFEIDEAQMLERYYRQLRKDIPENADVEAFVGFSLGGELSYHLAYMWERRMAVFRLS